MTPQPVASSVLEVEYKTSFHSMKMELRNPCNNVEHQCYCKGIRFSLNSGWVMGNMSFPATLPYTGHPLNADGLISIYYCLVHRCNNIFKPMILNLLILTKFF